MQAVYRYSLLLSGLPSNTLEYEQDEVNSLSAHTLFSPNAFNFKMLCLGFTLVMTLHLSKNKQFKVIIA